MRAVGIILAGGNSNKMRELTHKRAVAAMPIAGSYRAIDFALSNMSNSHIQKVAVLTQYNARPLGIVPRWKVGICGTESTGKKDETTSGKEKADIGRTGVFGILRR